MSTIGSDLAFSRAKPCYENHLRTLGGKEWKETKNGERYKEKFCFTKELAKGGFGLVYIGHRQFEKENGEITCKEEEIIFKEMTVNDREKNRAEREI